MVYLPTDFKLLFSLVISIIHVCRVVVVVAIKHYATINNIATWLTHGLS